MPSTVNIGSQIGLSIIDNSTWKHGENSKCLNKLAQDIALTGTFTTVEHLVNQDTCPSPNFI